ncbi:hypothetical protein EV426DRAFT_640542 [Tirmania nivea]|nr:hypothetical protein EV426DRAFT_640542 [Tirmania nivea]
MSSMPDSVGQRESKSGRLLAPMKQFWRSHSPSSSEPSSQQCRQPSLGPTLQIEPTDTHGRSIQAGCISNAQQRTNDLWSKAYEQLPEKYKTNLDNLDKLDVLQKLFGIAKQAEEQNLAKQCKIQLGNMEINMREKVEGFVGWLHKFKEIGDIAMQYDPGHAALPWAGVRFILMLVVGHQEKLAAAIVAMERIAILIGRCTIYEQLYLYSNDIPDIANKATGDLRAALLALYTAILQALCRLISVFKGKCNPLKSPEATLAEIKSIEGAELLVDAAASILDQCYSSHTRIQNKGDSIRLRALLQDFNPVILRMDTTVTAVHEEIKEQERITILKWFSTIPYKDHHDHACEGRVELTGSWLFERREFIDWQQSEKPNLLWLHGIPGAGKTKLVSATIECLREISHRFDVRIDKVAFFYCKRDEVNRRDRRTLLLALVKQLASPPDTDTGIYTEVLEAYKKEQKDPSSRCQLNIKDSLQLLDQLLKHYKHPAIVVDALDECPEETRGMIIQDLRSILDSAKHPVKVSIASRHSLDIEDRLQDLLHVRIEARDNAEDIENYVTKELDLRVRNKQLLRGKISEELKELIKKVLLRDAHGMFLWVDYQLRELCKLTFTSDIRTRLGKLPKDLSGVYDEIMMSIESRPGAVFEFATRALKWMVVAKRPLKPEELIAATELNPLSPPPTKTSQPSQTSQPFQTSQPAQEPSLDIEMVINICGGLIILDRKLQVLRFAHLSVQEYLETRENIWGIIDAHRFVSEGCLWTLQCGPSPEPAIYDYAGHYWFRHCRSYQDLALSQNTQDFKHALDIPILNTYLGSFDCASIPFAWWVGWLEKISSPSRLREESVRSKPLSPAFAAAIFGLGELVSWLWHSEGVNMGIKNEKGQSLLYLASRYGTTWIMTCVLTRSTELDINEVGPSETALSGAAYSGSIQKATLPLDRGADVNLTFDCLYGTALSTAAAHGKLKIYVAPGSRADVCLGRLQMAKLLLDRGADINFTSDGICGTALGAAAFGGKVEMAMLLLDRGADVNLTFGGICGTALGAAAFSRNVEMATLLLDRGADINLTFGGICGTALGAAALSKNVEMATLLLDRGADINLTFGGICGTALGAAAFSGKVGMATLLLDRGANPDLTNNLGNKPRDLAKNFDYRDIIKLLDSYTAGKTESQSKLPPTDHRTSEPNVCSSATPNSTM